MASYSQWYIGPSAGDDAKAVEINSVEICAEEIANANWFEWDGSQMIESKNIAFQCIDDIICTCQKLEISGFKVQKSRNGLYTFNNSSLSGRNRFLHKIVVFTI